MEPLHSLGSYRCHEHIDHEERWKNNLSLLNVYIVIGGQIRGDATWHVLGTKSLKMADAKLVQRNEYLQACRWIHRWPKGKRGKASIEEWCQLVCSHRLKVVDRARLCQSASQVSCQLAYHRQPSPQLAWTDLSRTFCSLMLIRSFFNSNDSLI